MELYHNKLDLGFCFAEHTSDDIIIYTILENTHVELDMIQKMLGLSDELHQKTGKFMRVCTIIQSGVTISKEAREFGSTENANRHASASAVVMNSLAHKILGNFFMNVQKPVVPFKIFNSVDDATPWLLTHNVSQPAPRFRDPMNK